MGWPWGSYSQSSPCGCMRTQPGAFQLGLMVQLAQGAGAGGEDGSVTLA